jgi:uncharacterized protein (TIGR02147 family)
MSGHSGFSAKHMLLCFDAVVLDINGVKQSVLDYSDYKDFLLDEFQRRLGRNKRYSMRSFSKDLDLRPAALSDIMNGRYGLSSAMAQAIATHLGLEGEEAQYFVSLVDLKHGRSAAIRNAAEKKLRERGHRKDAAAPVDDGKLNLIRHWYYPAILELTVLMNRLIDPAMVSSRLGISIEDAREALQVLEEIGCLKRIDGGYARTSDAHVAERPSATPAIQNFHKQILNLASQAVSAQEIAKRKAVSTVFSICENDLPEARAALNKFSDDFVAKFHRKEEADSIYAVTLQLFRLDKPV